MLESVLFCVCGHVLHISVMFARVLMEYLFRGAYWLGGVPICSTGPNCSLVQRNVGKKTRNVTVLVPCPGDISVTLKERRQHASDYCHVNNGTRHDSLLMNVIYFSKRGLIIDRGPLSPPTGSATQLAAKGCLLKFIFFKFMYICIYVCICSCDIVDNLPIKGLLTNLWWNEEKQWTKQQNQPCHRIVLVFV